MKVATVQLLEVKTTYLYICIDVYLCDLYEVGGAPSSSLVKKYESFSCIACRNQKKAVFLHRGMWVAWPSRARNPYSIIKNPRERY